MPASKYFAYAATLLKVNPAHITDEPIVAQLKRIGIEPGKSFDIEKLDPAVRNGLASAPEDAQRLMQWKIPTLARVVNQWSMNTDTMGVYGNYYLKRAIIAQVGLGERPGRRDLRPADAAEHHARSDGDVQAQIEHERSHLEDRSSGRAVGW